MQTLPNGPQLGSKCKHLPMERNETCRTGSVSPVEFEASESGVVWSNGRSRRLTVALGRSEVVALASDGQA